ncbi:hypothetical protein [Aliterella atlantica]|uniref:hypothetical protein n=1 Tax=Aliterella atlantica TaxID=1827278 RepID=UPI0019100A88|nr:hypothetical protein [Aliterella atlantica]
MVLIDNPNTRVTVRNIVQTLVFEDEEENTISETNGCLVGKLIEVRFGLLRSCGKEK